MEHSNKCSGNANKLPTYHNMNNLPKNIQYKTNLFHRNTLSIHLTPNSIGNPVIQHGQELVYIQTAYKNCDHDGTMAVVSNVVSFTLAQTLHNTTVVYSLTS